MNVVPAITRARAAISNCLTTMMSTKKKKERKAVTVVRTKGKGAKVLKMTIAVAIKRETTLIKKRNKSMQRVSKRSKSQTRVSFQLI